MYEKRYSNMADSERVKLESDVEDSYDIYPHPTVRVVRPHSRGFGKSWKEALTELTQRKAFLGALAVLVFILLLSIVIILMVQTNHAETQPEFPKQDEKYGLFSYPSASNGVISFKPDDFNSYKPWMEEFEEVLSSYSPNLLHSHRYTHCNMAERTGQQQCLFHLYELGTDCSHGHDFGFSRSSPCILLKLLLPYHPGHLNESSNTWKTLKDVFPKRLVHKHVGIMCEGKTEQDKLYLSGPGSTPDTQFKYTPSEGFSSAFFPSALKDEIYLAPLVMVQLRTLRPHDTVTVKCTAWAQKEDGSLPEEKDLYSTEFTVRMD